MKLTPKQQGVVSANLESLARAANTADFSSPKRVGKDKTTILDELLAQKQGHRERLIKFICWMAVASFVLLVIIVMMQMIIRIWNSEYSGVSDSVVKTLTVGVFGQIIGVVASIVLAVWKDKA